MLSDIIYHYVRFVNIPARNAHRLCHYMPCLHGSRLGTTHRKQWCCEEDSEYESGNCIAARPPISSQTNLRITGSNPTLPEFIKFHNLGGTVIKDSRSDSPSTILLPLLFSVFLYIRARVSVDYPMGYLSANIIRYSDPRIFTQIGH